MSAVLPQESTPGDIVIVVKDKCGHLFSLLINGGEARCLGQGDHHDEEFDDLVAQLNVSSRLGEDFERCEIDVFAYPSIGYRDQHTSPIPNVTIVVAIAFFAFSSAILSYNLFIQNKQQQIIAKASRSEAIVQSLFPTNVRERLLVDGHAEVTNRTEHQSHTDITERLAHVPIADLFPSCSVIFMDLANFTAWSRYRKHIVSHLHG